MSSRRRRPKSLFGAIVADPYRKLAAIALAIGLWHFLDSQVTATETIVVSLRTSGIPAEGSPHVLDVLLGDDNYTGRRFLAVDEPISTVELTLKGPRSELADALREGKVRGLEFQVPFEERGWTEKRLTIDFTVRDVVPPMDLQPFDLTMRPSRIELELDRKASISIPIDIGSIDLQFDTPDLADQLDTERATFSIREAEIVGPATNIERFQQILDGGTPPFRAWFSGSPRGGKMSARAELNVTGLGLSSPSFLIEAPIRAMRLPITTDLLLVVDDGSLPEAYRGRYRLDPDPEKRYWRAKVLTSGQLRTFLLSLGDGEQGDEARQQWLQNYMRLNAFLGAGNETPPKQIPADLTLHLVGRPATIYGKDDYKLDTVITPTFVRKE